MAEKRNIQPSKIHLKEFRLINGQINSPFDFNVGNIKSFDFKVDFNTGFNFAENLIKANFNVSVSTVSTEPVKDEAIGVYSFVFIFEVEDLSDHAKLIEGAGVDMNPYLSNAIASITYSTSRGILLSRFQGTVMSAFLLPVIDPNTLFQPPQPVADLK